MMKFDAFGWTELISLIAVIISFATIILSMKSKMTADTKNDQRVLDKLDNLTNVTKETNDEVKTINKKIDDHAERLATLEAEMKNVFFRVKRVEDTQDHCQACRASKEHLFDNKTE